MEPKGERTRAMEFFSRLRPSLRRAIRLSGINPLPQTRQAMLSLATRMWEEIKNEEKDPRKKPFERQQPTGKGSSAVPTERPQQIPPKPNSSENRTENSAERKAANRPRRSRGPKEYASGLNEKGERICYVCGSTEHLAGYHKKDNGTGARGTNQKKPGVSIVRTATGRKKGQERLAEKAWNLTDSDSESENN